jgi:hypothetical protein
MDEQIIMQEDGVEVGAIDEATDVVETNGSFGKSLAIGTFVAAAALGTGVALVKGGKFLVKYVFKPAGAGIKKFFSKFKKQNTDDECSVADAVAWAQQGESDVD